MAPIPDSKSNPVKAVLPLAMDLRSVLPDRGDVRIADILVTNTGSRAYRFPVGRDTSAISSEKRSKRLLSLKLLLPKAAPHNQLVAGNLFASVGESEIIMLPGDSVVLLAPVPMVDLRSQQGSGAKAAVTLQMALSLWTFADGTPELFIGEMSSPVVSNAMTIDVP